jgi:hypothetical protein
MSEEDLELLITTDDPGEDTLEEDHFHLQADNTARVGPVSLNDVATPTSKQK